MRPETGGAHCERCCKTVIDFSDKSAEEIRNYFTVNAGQRICGRYRPEQVTVPVRKFSSQIIRFAAACWLVFGTLLFSSCGQGENRHITGDSMIRTPYIDSLRRIDSIRQDSADRVQRHDTMGQAKIIQKDSIR